MVIYAPLSFVLSMLHKRSQELSELKQSQGSQLGVWVQGCESHKLAEICFTARREMGRNEGSNDLVQSSGYILYLASDASSSKMKLYVLLQDVTTATKKGRAMCFDADMLNPLTFTEEAEREISVKDICGSLKENFVNLMTILLK